MNLRKISEGLGRRPALRWLFSLLFLLVWAVGLGAVSLFFAAATYGPELRASYYHTLLIPLLNILPGLLLALVLFGITNRVWPGVLASGAAVLLGSIVNHFKLLTRSMPLLATDLQYMMEAANISSRYTLKLTPVMLLSILAVIAATVFALLLMKARFRRVRARLVFLAALLLAGAGLYFGVYTADWAYAATENYDVAFASGYRLSPWSETDKYCSRGFVYPFLRSTHGAAVKRPDGYSVKQAQQLLAEYDSADIPEEKKVSIISVMLEAYADLSGYRNLDFTSDPYAFFHELQAESIRGELVTNIFAGGTINTERCYISGSTEMYDYRSPADSYARWFAAQGYDTEFCHPGYNWFYNRRKVAQNLGFDASHFDDDTYHCMETYKVMRDNLFFPALLDAYRTAHTSGRPYFNFSVTYQNHGPYAGDYLYDTEREYVARGSLSEESYNILNNYFWGLSITDEALREFIGVLRDDSEPVVVVLFGDHKPWLGEDSTVYYELDIDLSTYSEASFYNYYNTPYLIWANDAAKAVLGRDFCGEGGDFSPCFLMMKLFDACGYTGDGYLNALRELYPLVDVVNGDGRFRSGGVLTDTLAEDAQTALQRVQTLQYYRMHDAVRR